MTESMDSEIQPAAAGQIKIRIGKTSLVWAGVVLSLVLLYGVAYVGYHRSLLPSSFDEYVQGNGLWRIFGKKEYVVTADSGESILSIPSWEAIVESTELSYTFKGYAMEFEVSENAISGLQLALMDEEPLVIDGPVEVEDVFLETRGAFEYNVALPAHLEDLKIGDFVEMELYRVDGSEWKIDQLIITRG